MAVPFYSSRNMKVPMSGESNLTDLQCDYPVLELSLNSKFMLIGAYGFVGALSLIGNLAVLLLVLLRKEMQTVTNIFISSVSAADLVITSFSLWVTPLNYYQRVWSFGKAMCYIFQVVQGASLMWVPFTLAAVALDRYLLVRFPFRKAMSKRSCILVISGIWFGSLAVLTPMMRMIEFVDSYGPCHFCMETWDNENPHYRLFYGLAVLLIRSALPLLLISLCHWRIASILNKQTRKFNSLRSASAATQSTDIKRKQRLQQLLLAMVIIFAVSSLPLDLMNVLQDLILVYGIRPVNKNAQDFLFFFCHWMAMAGTLLNPLVYAWWNENFRRQIHTCVDEMRGEGKFKRGLYSMVSGRYSYRIEEDIDRRQNTRIDLAPDNHIVGVRGKLSCNNRALQGATIKLIDKTYIGPDVILANNQTDYQGYYEVIGTGRGVFEMDVYLKIFHDCDDALIPCQRTVTLRVPSTYINRGNTVNKYFEAGQMNMAFRYPDEQRSCRHQIFPKK
ncbi:unnamed protein product [Caenorhabditis angaria]|uniref:G-protein coupled receptors family 1 profile domain-containing protein n=1 Tax=Caenorhabditis angaria TaxID=860376 RepID=A0A9P1NBC4_9PELO|nr:unnamed protein product [Caenorhabditis angaria]